MKTSDLLAWFEDGNDSGTMPEKRLPPKRNAYRFRGSAIDVIAELPKAAQGCIRRGGDVVVTVEWHEPQRTGVKRD